MIFARKNHLNNLFLPVSSNQALRTGQGRVDGRKASQKSDNKTLTQSERSKKANMALGSFTPKQWLAMAA